MRTRHEVRIQQIDGGAVVTVGCKSVAFTAISIACQEVARYFEDPEGVEKEYAARYKWPTLEDAPRMAGAIRGFDLGRGADSHAAIERTVGDLGAYIGRHHAEQADAERDVPEGGR